MFGTRGYGPPETDSEDDYDGFYFGDQVDTKKVPIHRMERDWESELCENIPTDNLQKFKEVLDRKNFNVNNPIKGGLTLLLHACQEGSIAIAEFLLKDKKADSNLHIDSLTPLIMICNSINQNLDIVYKMVKLLLEFGAVVNCSDKYGVTPLMLASKNGYLNVVEQLIKGSNLDAIDNNGNTAMFYAVENNQADVVQLLINAGVNTKMLNGQGYTAMQIAQFAGHHNLLELLPKDTITPCTIPLKFHSYNSVRDYIPQIFEESSCPEYFQEIAAILQSIGMDEYLEHFAGKSLAQFLVINNDDLKEMGLKFPIHRMKILKGILFFHTFHWSTDNIACVSSKFDEKFHEILMITANHLQHLCALSASIRFLNNHIEQGTLDPLSSKQIRTMKQNLILYRKTIEKICSTTKYLSSFSPPKNPIYIDEKAGFQKSKNGKWKWYISSIVIIISGSYFLFSKVGLNKMYISV